MTVAVTTTAPQQGALLPPPRRLPGRHSLRPPRMVQIDPVSVLTVFLITLLVLPARYIVGPLGGAGTPATVMAVLMLVWYALSTLSPRWTPLRGPQPLRHVILFFALALLAGYVAGTTRPLSADELNTADMALIQLAGWAGIALVTADGIAGMDRLEDIRHRLVIGAAFVASIGLIQFFTGIEPSRFLALPGLVENGASMLFEREDFFRPMGTATHPIEMGMVLAMVLPLALHGALYGPERMRRRRWIMVVLIAVAAPMSVSRSALLGLAVALIVLLPVWPPAWRLRALLITGIGVILMRLAVPGLIGTVLNLVTVIGEDDSTVARTDDYAEVVRAWAVRPFFGQGTGTYLPTIYRVLDNQYLLTLVEAGLVGLLALLALLCSGWMLARGARRASADPAARHLAQCLAASVAVAIFGFGTFDAFSFPMISNVLFLILGFCGALWRLQTRGEQPAPVARGIIPRL
ncbi:O-antigen ligase [Thermocatellispora tengchongensis]|uniref:O-antigen ligase n=1 Tax=Thermocatellispora tengchongensis TaxID=1073253 RepID=A0A840PLT4_9ACTN|nr:O-antigen ligase family protein [Thermocatellispora tengchongensis]MBB5139909.1 O-antigen ligase [Thermocatellispora tengchongensis]